MVIAFVGAAWLWYLTLWDKKYVGTVAVMMAAFHALPFLNMTRVSLVQSPRQVAENMHGWYPLGNAALAVQPGSRVLLFASQDGADYLMFHPAYGYPTKVYPWGKAPFSATAFAKDPARDTGRYGGVRTSRSVAVRLAPRCCRRHRRRSVHRLPRESHLIPSTCRAGAVANLRTAGIVAASVHRDSDLLGTSVPGRCGKGWNISGAVGDPVGH